MYKTVFFLLLALALTACGGSGAAQAAGVMGTQGPTATRTVTPSPTVDWKQTAVVAQATADEARRLDTQATAQHEALIQEQIRITEAAEIREHEKFAGTATAAPTSVPLTQTARSVDLTATNAMMTLSAGQLTATFQAPTQAVAMIRVEYERRLGWVNYAAMGALAFFLFGVGVFALGKARAGAGQMVTYQQTAELEAVEDEEDGDGAVGGHPGQVQVTMRKDHGGGYFESRRYCVPCSPEQLTELAQRVLMRGETLGVNNWEGEKSSLSRNTIYALRNWFQMNRLAVSSGASGRVKLNEEGMAFLRKWLDEHALPHLYAFVPDGHSPLNMSHENMAHVLRGRGGA